MSLIVLIAVSFSLVYGFQFLHLPNSYFVPMCAAAFVLLLFVPLVATISGKRHSNKSTKAGIWQLVHSMGCRSGWFVTNLYVTISVDSLTYA
jgi:hypothetical protein